MASTRAAERRRRRRRSGAGRVDEPGGLVGVAGGQRRAGQHEQQVGDVGAVRARGAASTSGRPSASAAAGLPAAARICTSDAGGVERDGFVGRGQAPGALGGGLGGGVGAAGQRPSGALDEPLGRLRRFARPPRRGRRRARTTAPGRPGLARSTAGQAREARSRRSGGSSSPSTASRDRAWRNRKPSPSTSMICASTAARSASTAARPSTSATPGSSSQSNRRPSSAAARMTRRAVGSSAASRWRIDCSTSIRDRRGQRAGGRSSAPSSTDEGAGGHQPGEQLLHEERDAVAVGAASRRGHRAGTASEPRQAATMSRTSSGGRAATSRSVTPSCRRRRAQRLDRPALGPRRAEAEDRLVAEGVGEVVDDAERLDVGPVQVLEEEQRGVGPAEPRAGRGGPRPRRGGPGTRPCPRRRRPASCGTSRPRWTPNPASCGSRGGDGPRKADANASVSGRYGHRAVAGNAAAGQPRHAALARPAPARRGPAAVLPTPASPDQHDHPAATADAPRRAPRRASPARVARPTTTGAEHRPLGRHTRSTTLPDLAAGGEVLVGGGGLGHREGAVDREPEAAVLQRREQVRLDAAGGVGLLLERAGPQRGRRGSAPACPSARAGSPRPWRRRRRR